VADSQARSEQQTHMLPPRRPRHVVTCMRGGSGGDSAPPYAGGSRCHELDWGPVTHGGAAAGACVSSGLLHDETGSRRTVRRRWKHKAHMGATIARFLFALQSGDHPVSARARAVQVLKTSESFSATPPGFMHTPRRHSHMDLAACWICLNGCVECE